MQLLHYGIRLVCIHSALTSHHDESAVICNVLLQNNRQTQMASISERHLSYFIKRTPDAEPATSALTAAPPVQRTGGARDAPNTGAWTSRARPSSAARVWQTALEARASSAARDTGFGAGGMICTPNHVAASPMRRMPGGARARTTRRARRRWAACTRRWPPGR
jgi:hypothetical protein